MHRWSDPAATPDGLRPCVATFGNFDGVHLGHRAVLARLVGEAAERGLPSVAVTFDPHPAAIFHPDTPNDTAPSGYNNPQLPDGLLTSPLEPRIAPAGFRWLT